MPLAKSKVTTGKGPASMSKSATVTVNPATQTIVKVNQEQSLHIVKTTITASLSAILYIHDLFPESFFEHRTYSLADPSFPYTIAGSDMASKKKQLNDMKSVTWHILIPGKHKHADKVLSWLDGVGEALQLKYLESFVISFHNGHISPETVAEAYVLNFSYTGPGREPRIDLTSGDDTVGLTVKDMSDLKNLYRRLATLASGCSMNLDDKPMIGMQLTYNNTCPPEYEPPGFRSAPLDRVIDDSGGIEAGSMDTKFHQMRVRLLAPPAATATPIVRRIQQLSQAASSSPPNSIMLNTQDRDTRRQIKSMVVHRRNVEDTQLLEAVPAMSKPQQSATAVDGSAKLSSGGTAKDGTRTFIFEGVSLDTDQRTAVALVEGNGDCFCGKSVTDSSMLCRKCNTTQHRKCYGYLGTDVVLGGFMCYSCLLKDEGLVDKLRELCKARSVADRILKEGYPKQESVLAKQTGYLVRDVKAVSDKLTDEGYLKKIRRPNEKKAKAFRKGPLLPPYELVTATREAMVTQYFDPRVHMEAYIKLAIAEKKVAKRTPLPNLAITLPISPEASSDQLEKQIAPSAPIMSMTDREKQARRDMLSLDDDEEEDDDDDDDEDDALDIPKTTNKLLRISTGSSEARMIRGSPAKEPGKKRTGGSLEKEGPAKKQSYLRSPFPIRGEN